MRFSFQLRTLFFLRVFLELFVKVKEDWRASAGFIEDLDPATKERVHAIFSDAHLYLGYALYALLALHLLGVAKHHMFDHEAELQRMIPGRRDEPA